MFEVLHFLTLFYHICSSLLVKETYWKHKIVVSDKLKLKLLYSAPEQESQLFQIFCCIQESKQEESMVGLW